MNNAQFLDVLKRTFLKYLETDPRSNAKLKILHGEISRDLDARLLSSNDTSGRYSVASLNEFGGKENKISGRYDKKVVDIAILKNDKPIAGIAVKFVMSNYSQNSNNYFENMLGETANIRCDDIPYFQIFIVPDMMPYFDASGNIKNWETISRHNLAKYAVLSNDNVDRYMHTPNKTLLFIVSIPIGDNPQYNDINGYRRFYLDAANNFKLTCSERFSKADFGGTLVLNDYETFAKKVIHSILSL